MLMDRTGLKSCSMAVFDVSGVKPSSFTNTQQISYSQHRQGTMTACNKTEINNVVRSWNRYWPKCLPHLCQPDQVDVNGQNAAIPWSVCSHSLQQGVADYVHCGLGARGHLCSVAVAPLGYVLYMWSRKVC
jgi:hypothetical protein